MKVTDKALFLRVQNGDNFAFETLYRKYWEVLYRHSFNMLQIKDDASDVVQEVFTGLWKNKESLHIEESVSAYLYQSTRNNILNRIKHDAVVLKYMNSLYLDDYILSILPHDDLVAKELALNIERCIAHLPPKMREIFLLSREHGLTHKQIASLLGIAESTVKKQVSNALSVIRKKVLFLLLTF